MHPRPALLLCLLLAFLPGCQKSSSQGDLALRQNTLIIGNGAEPADLDPQTVTAFTDMNIMVALFEGLTVLDETNSAPLPGAAASWTHSADGLTWTFKLRPEGKWSNGSPVTAEDFVYSFHRILSPKLAAEYAYMLWPLKNARALSEGTLKDFSQLGARALDPLTLELQLEAPCPWLLTLVSNQPWFPVHRATIEKFGAMDERGTRWTRPENLVCNGPFLLREWAPQLRVVVEANPFYWDTHRSSLRKIIFNPNESIATDERNFRTGQIHVTYDLPPEKIEAYKAMTPSPLRIDPFYETFFLRLNTAKAPFNDPRVRLALALAIKRQEISHAVLHDSRPPATSLTPPGAAGYVSTYQLQESADTARRLLAEAGFPGGAGFPTIEIQLKSDDLHRSVMEAVQEMWKKELGINATLSALEQKTWLANQASKDYQISTSRWIGDYLDANTFLDLWLSDNGKNQTNWANPAYDQLINRAARCLETAERQALQQKAEQILLENSPVIPIFYGARTYLVNPAIDNWPPALLGLRRFQYVEILHP